MYLLYKFGIRIYHFRWSQLVEDDSTIVNQLYNQYNQLLDEASWRRKASRQNLYSFKLYFNSTCEKKKEKRKVIIIIITDKMTYNTSLIIIDTYYITSYQSVD